MGLFDGLHYRVEFFFLSLIYGVVQIFSDYRTVRGNLNNVHAVDLAELLLLCERRTGHAGFLVIFIKEVLERNIGQRLALALYLNMLLGLDSLMQAVRIAAAGHDTSCKLVYNQNLIILYHVVLIPEHQIVSTQRQDNIVLNLQIFRISQVFNVEIILHALYAVRSQIYNLILFIDNKITRLCDLLTHDGVHLAELTAGFAPLHGFCQDIADLIKLCGLSALAGNDKRGPRLINQYRVHLVDDGVMKIPLYQLLLINNHIVTQVIEAELIIRHVSDVAGIGCPALISCASIEHHAYGQAQRFMDLSHPFCVTVSQIIVYRNNMDALAFQRVQICGKRRYQRLSFTGLHLGDTALMQNNSSDQLYPVMLHAEHTSGCLADCGKCVHQQIIQRLAVFQTLLKLFRLTFQFLVRQLHHFRTKSFDSIYNRINPL